VQVVALVGWLEVVVGPTEDHLLVPEVQQVLVEGVVVEEAEVVEVVEGVEAAEEVEVEVGVEVGAEVLVVVPVVVVEAGEVVLQSLYCSGNHTCKAAPVGMALVVERLQP